MPVIPEIADRLETFAAIRRDIHAHPEIGFQEVRTSGIVVEKLKEWGIEVHAGIGGTGVVGIIEGKGPGRSVGLRAEDGAATAVRHITTFLADEVQTGVWREAFDAKIRRRKPPCGGWCPCACCGCLCTCCAVCCTPHPFGPPAPR